MGSKIQDFPDVVLRRGDREFKSRWRGTQWICSSKYLFFRWMFAGWEFKNNCVLRRKAVLGIDNSGCLSGFWAQNSWYVLFFRRPPSSPPPFRMEGVNFALRPHPISYRMKVHLAGWELVHHTCWEWGTCRCWREIHSLSSGTIALFFLRYELTVEGKLVLRMACALSSRLSSIQRNLKIRALQIDAAMSAHTLLFLRTLMLNTLEHAWSRTKVKY